MTDSGDTPVRMLSLAQLARRGAWEVSLPHDRSEHLMIWITRGQGRLLLGGTQSGFGPHTLLNIPARSMFSLDPGPQVLGHVLTLSLPACETLHPSPSDIPQAQRISSAIEQVALTALFESLQKELRNKATDWPDALMALAQLTVIQQKRLTSDASRSNAATRLINAYCTQISRTFASGAGMADHAATLGVTPTHLTRVCKAQTGRSAADLLSQRIAHAARIDLLDSGKKAQEIAKDLGFANASGFNRFVRRHFGKPPGALRRG